MILISPIISFNQIKEIKEIKDKKIKPKLIIIIIYVK
jgi:hypothetical protein